MAANGDDRRSGIAGAIYLHGPVGIGGIRVAAKSQWNLSLQRDYYDGSAFGDSNKQWYPGLRDTQGTYKGLFDNSGDLLFNAAALASQLLYLYSDDNTASSSISAVEVAHGSGFLDATVDCSLSGMVEVNGQFRASSRWTFFTGA